MNDIDYRFWDTFHLVQRIAELESKLTNIKSAWINLTEYESCDTMVITLESYEKLQAAIEGKV
jgi:hypothetical protein